MRETRKPEHKPCRVSGCTRKGVNNWCHEHNPPEGSGFLRCHVCQKPLAEHKVGESCREYLASTSR